MTVRNEMKLEFLSKAANIALARVTMAAFASQLDLTLQDLDEIKLVVSEAVSNAVIHGYQNSGCGIITLKGCINDNELEIIVDDKGCGIRNIEQAMTPLFSESSERMGMGFAFMHSLMDYVQVNSQPGLGTEIRMIKNLPAKHNSAGQVLHEPEQAQPEKTNKQFSENNTNCSTESRFSSAKKSQ